MKFKKCDYIIQQPKGSLLQLRLFLLLNLLLTLSVCSTGATLMTAPGGADVY